VACSNVCLDQDRFECTRAPTHILDLDPSADGQRLPAPHAGVDVRLRNLAADEMTFKACRRNPEQSPEPVPDFDDRPISLNRPRKYSTKEAGDMPAFSFDGYPCPNSSLDQRLG
jgi:hypothetical protein